jgi:hypothetical protein
MSTRVAGIGSRIQARWEKDAREEQHKTYFLAQPLKQVSFSGPAAIH